MTILFDSQLSDRDFASHLMYVPDLLEWARSKRLHIRTTPPLDSYEFVQVEALLCAIERKAGDLTTEQAMEIVASDPALQNERAAGDPTTARWLLGAEAHRKWRVLLASAIDAEELALLDFGSKLPVNIGPHTSSPAAPETQGGVASSAHTPPAEHLLSTGQLALVFRDIHFSMAAWKRNLEDPPQWLLSHKKLEGKKGNKPVQAKWDALGIAKALSSKKSAPLDALRQRFKAEPLLAPLRAAWKEFDEAMFG